MFLSIVGQDPERGALWKVVASFLVAGSVKPKRDKKKQKRMKGKRRKKEEDEERQ